MVMPFVRMRWKVETESRSVKNLCCLSLSAKIQFLADPLTFELAFEVNGRMLSGSIKSQIRIN